MEFNEKYGYITKRVIFLFFLVLLFQCKNTENEKTNCKKLNAYSATFIEIYYDEKNKEYLDSALVYINEGIDNCSDYVSMLSMRKLVILSEQRKFIEAIEFIKTIEEERFTALPYYQELLLLRFKAMDATMNKESIKRDKFIEKCICLIEGYLSEYKKTDIDSHMRKSKVDDILGSSIGTSISQYYYYRYQIDKENVKVELLGLKNRENINSEFIEYLLDLLQEDFMTFIGI